MKIAVISDLHSNIVALDSVLNDIIIKKVDTIVCTGDIVGYLPFPKEVVQRMREKNIMSIKGNHDDAVASAPSISSEDFDSFSIEEIQRSAAQKYTIHTLDEGDLQYLQELPGSLSLTFDDFSIRFVHGSPNSIAEYMYEEDEILKNLETSFDEDAIVSGHTHIPYHKVIGTKHFMNAGSVGKPKHGNSKSSYLILDICNGELGVEIVEVGYDVDGMAKAIEDNPYINNNLIDNLRQGK